MQFCGFMHLIVFFRQLFSVPLFRACVELYQWTDGSNFSLLEFCVVTLPPFFPSEQNHQPRTHTRRVHLKAGVAASHISCILLWTDQFSGLYFTYSSLLYPGGLCQKLNPSLREDHPSTTRTVGAAPPPPPRSFWAAIQTLGPRPYVFFIWCSIGLKKCS
jgi:hypothetical protein